MIVKSLSNFFTLSPFIYTLYGCSTAFTSFNVIYVFFSSNFFIKGAIFIASGLVPNIVITLILFIITFIEYFDSNFPPILISYCDFSHL